MKPRVALLVDGDNISAQHASFILKGAGALGQVDILRCYLNAQKSSPWLSLATFRSIHAGSGKNASDVLLTIEAMELAYCGSVSAFAIASSDADYSHLARHLREKGFLVHGFGEHKTPPAFRASCSAFTELSQPAATRRQSVTTAPTTRPLDLEQTIRSVIATYCKNGNGMKLTELSPKMNQLHGVRISAEKEKTWRAYFLARPRLFDIDARGAECRVRLRPEGFAQ